MSTTIEKLTPILIVESVENSLPFWEKRLGYTITVQVPHDDRLGFVILRQGESEVMLQSRSSLAADLPAIAGRFHDCSMLLYANVASLDEVEAALGEGCEVVVPRRQTFYGAWETWVREPSGNIVGFAQHSA